MFKVIVTGACGFIGHQTILALKKSKQFQLLAVDSLEPFHKTRLTMIRHKSLLDSGVDFVRANILDPATMSVDRIGEADLILHFAAFPGVRIGEKEERNVEDNNVKGFMKVLDYARSVSAKIIYASSSSVYGDLAVDGACKEEFFPQFQGKGVYAQSKWQNEMDAVAQLRKGDVEALGLRLFSVFGKYGREDMAYFKFGKLIRDNKPIEIFDSMEDERDYTPISIVVDDIVELSKMALLNPERFTQNFFTSDTSPFLNIGSGSPKKLKDLIEFYSDFFGVKPRVSMESRLTMECTKTWSDNSKRNSVLSTRASNDFYTELRDFASWVHNF